MQLSFSPRSRWAAGGLVALLVLVALALAWTDWNWLRAPIASRVSAATGRTFAIQGNLELHWGWPPRIVANDVVLGTVPGSRDAEMVRVRRIEATVQLLPLLSGRVELPQLTLSQPRLALEVGPDGRGNWVLGKQQTGTPPDWPQIGRLAIDAGSASFRDAANDTDLAFELRTLDASGSSPYGLALSGKGRFRGLASVLQARGGALLTLADAGMPFPIEAGGRLGNTGFSLDGVLLDPLRLQGERLQLKVVGNDMAQLFQIVGIPLPASPPYQISGLLDHKGAVWALRGFKGTLGRSDLSGDLVVDRSRKPQKLTGTLVSRSLAMQDLAGFIGAPPAGTAAPRKTLLPTQSFGLDKLLAADVDVHFRGDRIITTGLALDSLKAHLVVNGGMVSLDPLDVGLAGGNLVAAIQMDLRQQRPATRAQLTAKGLRLDRMAPDAKLGGVGTGTLGGRATLKGSGTSVSQMMASANGDAALIMQGGSVGELALRLSNLDVANSLLLLLGGDRQVPVRCLVGVFQAVEGDFKVQSLVLDTPKVAVNGSGRVDFRDETLHLQLVSESKGFSLASLRGPIAVSGTFLQPVVRPEAQGAVVRGGLAVALGVVTGGLGALIPLVDFGTARESDCAGLLTTAREKTGVKTSDTQPKAAGKAR